ncbi:MAG TPA: hypothetical protein VGL90_07360 [Casimicrobiaceae bacterium]
MPTAPLVLTFDVLERAEAARSALIEAGFARDAVQVRAREDEAGATQGDFTVGSGRAPAPSATNYDVNFGNEAKRGQVLMTVVIDDAPARERALRIVQPFGAIDVERRTSGGTG